MTSSPCCEIHGEVECCDPNDCGPCCENCPTCPSLHKEWLDQLTDEERRTLAHHARNEADSYDDPRYRRGLDLATRARERRRWELIADALCYTAWTNEHAERVYRERRTRRLKEEGLR